MRRNEQERNLNRNQNRNFQRDEDQNFNTDQEIDSGRIDTGRSYGRSDRYQNREEERRFGSGYDRQSEWRNSGLEDNWNSPVRSDNRSGFYNNNQNNNRTGFYGKGPKGWKRSDERIREEACEALYRDYSLDASDIDLTVKDGCVYLKGSVNSREAKRAAEECVEHLSGVDDVQNELKIKKVDEALIGRRDSNSRSDTSNQTLS